MAKNAVFLLVLSALAAHSEVNFPYPQEKSYGNGTINTTSSDRSTKLKNKFDSFLSKFYETGTCPNNRSCARIKWDETDKTVSEGIGYGMLMMVYFSDNTKSYKDEFDLLWAYYQSFLNDNKLMNWKINGFSGFTNDGKNAATDAEVDVALALVMAHYQFGSTSNKNYLDTAKSLISKIRLHEVSTNNLLKPGDTWDSERNPSYLSFVAFEIFKEVESSQAAKWQSVIDANYAMLIANQNSTSGLFSDWCRDNGSHSRGAYEYDAARTPWRLAWANAWYGHANAKTLLTNLYTKFLQNKNASEIAGPYALTGGNTSNHKNSTFVGPFTNALSYNSTNQTKMDTYWNTLIGFNNEPYYSAALQLLTGLLASGNMPNLAKSTPGNGGPSSSSSSISSSSSNSLSSSSSGGNTSVILPQAVSSNRLNAMQNAVNLQAIDNAEVQIFDLNGNVVRTFSFARGSYVVSMADLPKGLYIVKASFGNHREILQVPVR
jgi:endo-1,4-beta-D-glucanase Y